MLQSHIPEIQPFGAMSLEMSWGTRDVSTGQYGNGTSPPVLIELAHDRINFPSFLYSDEYCIGLSLIGAFPCKLSLLYLIPRRADMDFNSVLHVVSSLSNGLVVVHSDHELSGPNSTPFSARTVSVFCVTCVTCVAECELRRTRSLEKDSSAHLQSLSNAALISGLPSWSWRVSLFVVWACIATAIANSMRWKQERWPPSSLVILIHGEVPSGFWQPVTYYYLFISKVSTFHHF